MSAPAGVVFGSLSVAGGAPIALGERDALWLARAIVGEEGSPANGGATVSRGMATAIGSCMLRRLSLLAAADARRGRPAVYYSLEVLLSGRPGERNGYSNPVQFWRVAEGSTAERARRWAVQSLSIPEINPVIRRAVLELLSGRTPLTEGGSGAVHFASRASVASSLASGRGADWRRVDSPARNQLLSDAAGRAMTEPLVSPSGSAVGLLPFVALLALATAIARVV